MISFYVLVVSLILVTGQTAKLYRGVFPDLAACNEFMENAASQTRPNGQVKSFSMKCAMAQATIKDDK